MPAISIIVPVYNMSSSLARSVDSLLNQSFADFEAILVDDGSKDDSGALCDAYALRDSLRAALSITVGIVPVSL